MLLMPILCPECQVRLLPTLVIVYKGDYYPRYIYIALFLHSQFIYSRSANLNQREDYAKEFVSRSGAKSGPPFPPPLGTSRQKATTNFHPLRLKLLNPKYTFPSAEGK